MGVVGLPGTVADPDHVGGGAAVRAGTGGILARQRLLVAKQQRLMAGVEVGALELGMALEVEAAGLHEAERLGDAVRQLLVVVRLGESLTKPSVHWRTLARLA